MHGAARNKGHGKGRRKRLWQIEERLHCSIVGTCLTLAELRRLCRKANLVIDAPITDYEVHSAFVVIAGEPCHAARLLHKYLDRKYGSDLRRFSRAQSGKDLSTLWQAALESGQVAGAWWALATHPETPADLLDRAYGEVHMLSHLAGASVRGDLRELRELRERVGGLQGELDRSRSLHRRRIDEKERQVRMLQARLARARNVERDLEKVRSRLQALERKPLAKRVGQLSEKLAAGLARAEQAEAAAADWKQLALRTEDRGMRLERELIRVREERDALEQSLERLLAGDCPAPCMAGEGGGCPHLDLCGRRILYVGGRQAQCTHFRALVERLNGEFIHHDGGREDGRLRLGSVLPRADAVFCPLDCISHDAMNRVKRFCERHAKRLVLLPRASLSAFARGLEEVAA